MARARQIGATVPELRRNKYSDVMIVDCMVDLGGALLRRCDS
jgi:hypothetical protein